MKYKHLFKDELFDEIYNEEITPHKIAAFHMSLIDQSIGDELLKMADPDVVIKAKEDKQNIADIKTVGDSVQIMRKHIHISSIPEFLNKVSEFEDEIITEVLQRIKTSGNEYFIENTITLLIKCKRNTSAELMEMFHEIRNTYAQSMILVVIGFRGDEEAIPWVYDRYFEFKNSRFDEGDRAEGALAALHEMFNRFYAEEDDEYS